MKKAILGLCLGFACLSASVFPQTRGQDPIEQHIFPPELIMKAQSLIDLSELQQDAILAAIQETQSRVVGLEWKMQGAMQELLKSLDPDQPDESEVLSRLDLVLDLENQVKMAHLSLAVRIKTQLTPQQQRKLEGLRGQLQERR